MNHITLPKKALPLIVLSILFISSLTYSQVGINTVTPTAGSILDVSSSDKGILIPRVDILDLSTIAPITGGSAESLLVYNTNTSTGPGYFYWNGSEWVNIKGSDWKLDGNAGTTPGTGAGQNFLGTTDAQDMLVATNGSERFRITTDGRILATASGTSGSPLFGWTGDSDKGFYSSGADQLGIVTNGIQRLNVTNGELVANDPENDVDFRVATNGGSNTLFVDGGNDVIGIGTNTPNGLLDINSGTMGLVPPRVSLTSTLTQAPVVNPQGGNIPAGTTVYNTATNGSAPNNVAPGLYFWNGSRWVAFAGSPGGLDWTLTGNSGTTAGTNFLGTTDDMGLVISTNSNPKIIVNSDVAQNGEVIVNSTGFFANNMLQSFSTGTETAIAGFGNGTEETFYAQNSGGGVVGLLLNNAGDGLRSMTSLSTGNGIQATGGAFTSYSFPTTSSGGVFAGTYGASGISLSSTGTGVAGLGQGRTTIVVDPNGSGIAGSGDTLGVFAYAGEGAVTSGNRGNAAARFTLDADNDTTTNSGNDGDRASATLAGFDNVTPDGSQTNRDSYFGGYFSGGSESSGTPSYAYVGMRYRTNANGDGVAGGGQDYKVIGTGSNSTIYRDQNNTPRIMFSPEAPEILFQDFGTGQLVNGKARIIIDPILQSGIYVDENHPLKVYVTLEGDCNGVFVTDKSAEGFTVKELQGGTSNAAFSWQIVASRADTRDSNTGRVVSKHVGVRLPEGPGPLKRRVYETNTAQESEKHSIKENAQFTVHNYSDSNNTIHNAVLPQDIGKNKNQTAYSIDNN